MALPDRTGGTTIRREAGSCTWAAVLFAGALGLGSGSSAAQGAPSAADLRAQGAAAAGADRFEECVQAYAASLALEADAATLGELGLCKEALGRHVAAYDDILQALEREVPAAPAPVRAQWERFREAIKRLGPRVGRALLLIYPPAAETFLDGVSLGPYMSGRMLTVAPGKHVFTARLPGRTDLTAEATFRGGDFPDIALVFPPEPPPPSEPPPVPSAPSCATCAPPPRSEPCPVADDLPMIVDLCNALRIRWRRMDPTLGLLAGGLLSLGFTPDVGPGFFLGGEAHWSRREDWGFQVGAEARFFLPTYGGSTRLSEKDIDITLLELALVPCVRYKWVLGCASVNPGVVLSGGTFAETPEAKDLGPQPIFVLGIGPRLAVDIPVTERFGVRAFADLRFGPLPPTGYSVNGAYAIWSEPKVSGFVGLGVSFR